MSILLINFFVKGNLDPVAKYLKVKTRGIGKYEMAVPIAKERLCCAQRPYTNAELQSYKET